MKNNTEKKNKIKSKTNIKFCQISVFPPVFSSYSDS